jgi:hypothetical protein
LYSSNLAPNNDNGEDDRLAEPRCFTETDGEVSVPRAHQDAPNDDNGGMPASLSRACFLENGKVSAPRADQDAPIDDNGEDDRLAKPRPFLGDLWQGERWWWKCW